MLHPRPRRGADDAKGESGVAGHVARPPHQLFLAPPGSGRYPHMDLVHPGREYEKGEDGGNPASDEDQRGMVPLDAALALGGGAGGVEVGVGIEWKGEECAAAEQGEGDEAQGADESGTEGAVAVDVDIGGVPVTFN